MVSIVIDNFAIYISGFQSSSCFRRNPEAIWLIPKTDNALRNVQFSSHGHNQGEICLYSLLHLITYKKL